MSENLLFNPIEPYTRGFLDVDATHKLYWEVSGNPDGAPIILLHGGPGGGCDPVQRRFFDPEHFRIILFDQRGAGRSQPQGFLENNTLNELIEDIAKLCTHLKIDRPHIIGGSWGATLALAYALAYPDNCKSLILRGFSFFSPSEICWYLQGMRRFFPEAWGRFEQGHAPDDLLQSYYNILCGDDIAAAKDAASAWVQYETACASLVPAPQPYHWELHNLQHGNKILNLARLEAHYFLHETVDSQTYFIDRLESVRHIPCSLIHGRYDAICPIENAYRLHQHWPEADFNIVKDGGHFAMEKPVLRHLLNSIDHLKLIQ